MVAAAFLDPVMAAQATFRAVLDATARPGTVARLNQPLAAPPPLSAGAAAIALTLCDHDTPVWFDAVLRTPAVLAWLRFHTGMRIIEDPGEAAFAFVGAPRALLPFDQFSLGTIEYPDRSTTVVLQLDSLRAGLSLLLTGPGIRDRQRLQAAQLPPDMPERLAANRRHFPRGVDILFATQTEVMALPRSVRIASGDD
ncbi:MAG TPA: phosphonate C-P lyase system protein PhnH [Xanthobacteraceae bacterium]